MNHFVNNVLVVDKYHITVLRNGPSLNMVQHIIQTYIPTMHWTKH